jgi:hypothetical protein
MKTNWSNTLKVFGWFFLEVLFWNIYFWGVIHVLVLLLGGL